MKLSKPIALRTTSMTSHDAGRFLRMVESHRGDQCWVWSGYRDVKGYGQFWLNGRAHWAHRISYVLFVGNLHDADQVDHLCRCPSCVNPAHLESVSPRINRQRQARAMQETTP